MRKALISLAAVLMLLVSSTSLSATASATCTARPSVGSVTFWDNMVVAWSYNDSKKELTVSGFLSGHPMTTAILKPGQKTGTNTGSSGSNTATVDLDASFWTDTLAMAASQTDPARNGTNNGSF